MRNNMTIPTANQHDNGFLQKWFGPNRGTHWSIAASVAGILIGSFVIYSNT